jgi:hypothetical protein
MGKRTTAVPIFAMMRSSSKNAPKKMRSSEPAPAPTGSSRTGWKEN